MRCICFSDCNGIGKVRAKPKGAFPVKTDITRRRNGNCGWARLGASSCLLGIELSFQIRPILTPRFQPCATPVGAPWIA